jgi:hypothetical protein
MTRLMAAAPNSNKTEVVLRRHWLAFQGPPERFTTAVVPPR